MSRYEAEIELHESQLDVAWVEYLRSLDSGQHVDREALLRGLGDGADSLRDLLHTADLIEQMAGPCEGDESTSDITDSWPTPTSPDDTQPFVIPSSASPTDETRTLAPGEAADDATAPNRLGDYELLTEIGRGGMGVVYKARQIRLDRIVAVKMILAGRFASADDLQRFYTEAQAAAKLDHPNVVAIYQVGEIEGHHYFSMDFIEGIDLAKLLERQSLDPKQAARYLAEVAEAIDYAHRKGILHRDLKPANILIDELDRPLVSDFGLAKYLGQREGLTASGLAIGTPSYMSPEQAAGRHADVGPAADVYALGAILYAMLTGQPPHRGDSPVDTILKVIHQEPLPPSEIEPTASGDLETICLKCLQKDPKERYASAKELADDLRRYLRGDAIEAKPAGPIVRTARWVRSIPLVAALTGRRVLEPTVAHRRVQSALLCMMLLVPMLIFGVFALSRIAHNRLPRTVCIATGREDGMYYDFGRKLAESLKTATAHDVRLIATTGSGENREALLDDSAHVALLQANAVRGPSIAVIAPLYYEAVHVLVRRGRGIARMRDFRGKRLVIGAEGSGSRISAKTIFEHYGLTLDDLASTGDSLARLRDDETFDGAILTIGVGSNAMRELLDSGEFELLPIEDAQELSLTHPAYRPFMIQAADYGEPAAMPPGGIATVATTAFLAARMDAPDVLVSAVLESLYGADAFREGLIPRQFAAEWQGLALHPAARKYFEQFTMD